MFHFKYNIKYRMDNDNDNEIDIRKYMNYSEIKKKLINNPTELFLFEIVCILINNKLNYKNF